jgi:hypothetical protein
VVIVVLPIWEEVVHLPKEIEDLLILIREIMVVHLVLLTEEMEDHLRAEIMEGMKKTIMVLQEAEDQVVLLHAAIDKEKG